MPRSPLYITLELPGSSRLSCRDPFNHYILYYRFGAVIRNPASSLVLLVHDPDLF